MAQGTLRLGGFLANILSDVVVMSTSDTGTLRIAGRGVLRMVNVNRVGGNGTSLKLYDAASVAAALPGTLIADLDVSKDWRPRTQTYEATFREGLVTRQEGGNPAQLTLTVTRAP
jgi:hypothetical protein